MTANSKRDSPVPARSIRFAIICQNTALKRWQAQCIRALRELDKVRLELVIIADDPERQAEHVTGGAARLRHGLLSLYCTKISRSRESKIVDIGEELHGVPTVKLDDCATLNASVPCTDGGSEMVRERQLDFILSFVDNVPAAVRSAARYGVWSFQHGDEEIYRRPPACFWEIFTGNPVTAANLRRLTDRSDEVVILKRGFYKTIDYSYGTNLDATLKESIRLAVQACHDIRRGLDSYLDAAPTSIPSPTPGLPTNREMLHFLGRVIGNVVSRGIRRLLFQAEWNIGVVAEPIQTLVNAEFWPRVRWLPAGSRDMFVADPFGVHRDGRLHLLCEAYDHRLGKATIAHLEMSSAGACSGLQTAIETSFHLSYPYLLEHAGELYCIPEMSAADQVRLYRAACFPHTWELAAVLVENVQAADTTVFRYGNRWWMFFTDISAGENLRLFVWHASDLFGPWQPHLGNPVKTDIRSVRPAGAPFVHEGALYRPAQDCSRTYGGSMTINRIIRLTPTAFAEETVAAVGPDADGPYPEGTHTLSAVGNVTLIDGKRLVWRRLWRTKASRRGEALHDEHMSSVR